MINDFAEFCLWMHFVIDEIWLKISPFFHLLTVASLTLR